MTFTPVEQVLIRHAVQDFAGRWYGGPFNFGRSDAARYVSEGHLSKLCDKYGLREVWRAVAAEIEADPSVLETRLTEAQAEERRRARNDEARAIDKRAAEAFKARDLEATLKLIDEAELASPTFHDWDGVRAFARGRLGPPEGG